MLASLSTLFAVHLKGSFHLVNMTETTPHSHPFSLSTQELHFFLSYFLTMYVEDFLNFSQLIDLFLIPFCTLFRYILLYSYFKYFSLVLIVDLSSILINSISFYRDCLLYLEDCLFYSSFFFNYLGLLLFLLH